MDLTPEIELIEGEVLDAIRRVVRSGRFVLGPEVEAFEREAAAYLGVRHAVGLNSGTDALVIALRAMGIGPGDEVITSPFTFVATAEAVSRVGATPVFVDIDAASFNLDVSLIEAAVTDRTRCVIPVHLFGHAADMGPLLALVKDRGLFVLEDTAQALGGRYDGRALGTLGDAGAFSFFPTKNLGAFGDAGMLATDDDGIAERARVLRVHGAKQRYLTEVHGYNSRLDEIQAAVLRVKLPRLDEGNAQRRQVAGFYTDALAGVTAIKTPAVATYAKHVYHQYTIRVVGQDRDRVVSRLGEMGVQAMVYYPVPLHRLPIYEGLGYELPVADTAAREVLSLPIWPGLSREVQSRVVAALIDAVR